MPAYNLRLIVRTSRHDAGTIISDRTIDLGNTSGTSKWRLNENGRRPGTQQYGKTWSGNALVPGKRLTSFVPEAVEETIEVQLRASSTDDMLAQKTALERFFFDAMTAAVLRANGKTANYFLLEEKPNNSGTNTSTTEILAGEVSFPRDWLSTKLAKFVVDGILIRLTHEPYYTASVLELLSAEAINNSDGNYVDLDASGTDSVEGDQPSPLKIKVDGGDSTTTRLLVGCKTAGDVANFVHAYWAKDATEVIATADASGAWLDGDGTNNGEAYTAADTDEHCVWRWAVTSNVAAQYGVHRLFARGYASAADKYSIRARFGLWDGTQVVYPFGQGYTLEATELAAVPARGSGNYVPMVDCGEMQIPIPPTLATLYGFVIEIYTTCSDITGGPTLVLDGLRLLPTAEAALNTGYADASYDLGIAAAGVDAAYISAIAPEPSSYLANASGVVTFPRLQNSTQAIWANPQTLMRLFFMMLDSSQMHDYTLTAAITVSHELRVAGPVGA